jgi:uncharacterized protein (TIGR02145 family)
MSNRVLVLLALSTSLLLLSSGCAKKSGESAAPSVSAAASSGEPSAVIVDARDGKKYKTVTIGGVTWMAEDLDYQADSSWVTENCEPNEDAEETCLRISRLYDWETAKSACPAGWKLPDTADWGKLAAAAGGDEAAGKKLKSKSGWNNRGDESGGGGTDDFGFSALPGGYRHFYDRDIRSAGYNGYWWTAAENGSGDAYGLGMSYNGDYLDAPNNFNKSSGFSVRCVQGLV